MAIRKAVPGERLTDIAMGLECMFRHSIMHRYQPDTDAA
jgi:hypothetical protein